MKLIKLTPTHYVVVDDSEIKKGDWIYNAEREPSILECVGKGSLRGWQKITHSTQPIDCACSNRGYKLDTNCAERNRCFDKVQYLPLQEVKALIGEVDVEKMAEEYADFSNDHVTLAFGEKFNITAKRDYLAGYNQALEDNKEKKYTEEDVNKIRQILVEGAVTDMSCSSAVVELDKYIQSLQPKTEWEVEFVDGKLKLKCQI